MKFTEKSSLYRLAELAAELRSENGCPWDKKQDHMSLRKYVIEEAYEVIDAIESGKDPDIIEELGDLLYQIFAHSQIAAEDNRFTVDDVADAIIAKLIRRHPHVFGTDTAATPEEVLDKWERIKKEEKRSTEKTLLESVPNHLPALLKAFRIQEKTSRVGFDWESIDGPIEKIEEELSELKNAWKKNDRNNLKEELGDILFSIVNVSRFLDIDPEEALQSSNSKFIRRFTAVEKTVDSKNLKFEDLTLEELDKMWDTAKKELK
ncbi:MAG: nucleoside triphosphate pyrophosphohydrolase [Spirochaetes bacterium]|nr:nucleoside triphosphate pyrophosphohydrolase [Spirochaetota bacterium]